jgi:serine/threonine-protein kinase
MVYVPPGSFVFGSSDDDAYPDERPRRAATIDRGFFIGRTKTTWGQFRAFEAATGRRGVPGPSWGERVDEPVVGVTFAEAEEYAAWAGLRLPTELEWERAARGTDGRRYPWGDEPPARDLCAWAEHPDYGRRTAPVGAFPAGISPCGALDMAGNAFEWCATLYDAGGARVVRGGSFCRAARVLRASNRDGVKPDLRGADLGFRVAR